MQFSRLEFSQNIWVNGPTAAKYHKYLLNPHREGGKQGCPLGQDTSYPATAPQGASLSPTQGFTPRPS